MLATTLRVLVILALFVAFYSLWAMLLPPFEPTIASLAAPIMIRSHIAWLLIPAEGMLFGCACVVALWSHISRGFAIALITLGAAADLVMYALSIYAGFLGKTALVVLVAAGAAAYFMMIRAALTRSSTRPMDVLLVGALAGISVLIPWHGAWSFVGLFASKGLWWAAVLGICVISIERADRVRGAAETTQLRCHPKDS